MGCPARRCAVVVLALVMPACRESSPASKAHAPPTTRVAGEPGEADPTLPIPEQLIVRLREYHRLRQYHRIRDLVVAHQRDDIIRLLSAVDRILVTNARAMQLIREAHSAEVADRWDIAGVADSLGIFSQHLRIVDTTLDEDHAVVHYQIGRILPLRKAMFVRQNRQWLYQPDLVSGLTDRIDELAEALNIVVASLEEKPRTVEEIGSEYRNRVLPVIERMGETSRPGIVTPASP